ncbi:hypothetical protein NEMIN01_1178 [Nematocida minor]|uniref:uncharacterized protein n=1 Tax=Nematocida minor TaxID=1912983 RepID=UPI00222093D7|nr:uncharacterized protein NEMIN01_1178 [Nematocida minor]KAI5190713.1 hypothetical protein NEMIN01_1178 [Nematocida minor]
MKRLSGRKPAPSLVPEEAKEEELRWQEMEGLSGWFTYKMSKYFSLGIYPVSTSKVPGRRLKARNKINLSKLVGKIAVLDLANITRVKGALNEDCLIDTIRIKNTEVEETMWELVRKAKTVILHDVVLIRYKQEYLNNATSIDLLGSTVNQVGSRLMDLLNIKRKRVRVADNRILIFWDENKCSTCVLRYFDVYRVIQRLPSIRVMHFDGIEITLAIIKELRRHPITTIKMIGCKIHPLKVHDLVDTCKKTLTTIEFNRTAVAPATVEYLRTINLTVIINN